ncbi:MAG TPA: ABC transporter permease, partial [Thermomicrobiales bacterium]|nr:ABC transporter permease [Thermomicrobiales bacterium]
MEGAFLTVPAVVAGPFLAALLLRLLNVVGPLAGIGLTLNPQVTWTAFALGALAGVAAIVTLALPAIASARSSIQGQGGRSRQRTRGIAQRGAIDITLLAAAGIALFQLRRYGLPLTESVRGRLEVDPLLVAAPAIGLLAGALVALRLVPLLAAFAERLATRRGRAIAVLSAWQVARRPLRYARSALLLMLALAIGLFTVSYSSTWHVSQSDQADFQVGADLRVEPNQRPNGIPPNVLASSYRTLDGVEAVMPVSQSFRAIGNTRDTADILQIDVDRATEVVRFRDDLAVEPFAAMMAQLEEQRPTIETVPIPGDPRRLAVDVRANAVRGASHQLSLVIRDADGLLHRMPGERVEADDTVERINVPLSTTLADGTSLTVAFPIELVAIEFTARSVQSARVNTFELHGVFASPDAMGDNWQPVEADLGPGAWVFDHAGTNLVLAQLPDIEIMIPPEISNGVVGFRYDTGESWQEFTDVPYRLRPAGSRIPNEIPALVSRHLLDQLAFDIGDSFNMDLVGGGQRLVIAGVLDAFPTLDSEASLFVVVDLEIVLALDLAVAGAPLSSPGQYWLAVEDSQAEAVAESMREIPFQSAVVAPQHERVQILRTDPVALGMIGALSIGFVAAIVFALIGFVTSAAVSVRERLTEFALLRAIGLSPRQLAGWLLLEHGFLLIVSLVFGTLLGLMLSWLVLPQISVTQEATRAFPSARIVIPWGTVTLLELAAIATLVIVSGLLALLLRRIGLGTLLRIGEDA